MDTSVVLGIGALFIAAVSGTGLLWYFLVPRTRPNLDALRGKSSSDTLANQGGAPGRSRGREDPTASQLEELKQKSRKKFNLKDVVTLEEKFFRGGVFTDDDRKEFFLMRTFAPFVVGPIAGFIGSTSSVEFGLIGLILGAAVGMRLPYILLDRKIKERNDDMLFYLPLVIEQVVIGVSSSLDIGPCLQRVVTMADERDSHNCVTELLRVTQHYIRSGVSLEDALIEVGRRSGHNELKHAFMSLSQVAKHGGEVTRQLQELADAVSNQREAKIETKIKKLELEATVPVAVVFCGFLLIILSGFGIQIKNAFK